MLFLIAKTTAAAFNSLTFNSTPTAENIDCNNFVITVTCCRATLVVSWPSFAAYKLTAAPFSSLTLF